MTDRVPTSCSEKSQSVYGPMMAISMTKYNELFALLRKDWAPKRTSSAMSAASTADTLCRSSGGQSARKIKENMLNKRPNSVAEFVDIDELVRKCRKQFAPGIAQQRNVSRAQSNHKLVRFKSDDVLVESSPLVRKRSSCSDTKPEEDVFVKQDGRVHEESSTQAFIIAIPSEVEECREMEETDEDSIEIDIEEILRKQVDVEEKEDMSKRNECDRGNLKIAESNGNGALQEGLERSVESRDKISAGTSAIIRGGVMCECSTPEYNINFLFQEEDVKRKDRGKDTEEEKKIVKEKRTSKKSKLN